MKVGVILVLFGDPAGLLTLWADRVSGEIPFPSGQAVPSLPYRDEEVRTHRRRATLEVHHLQHLHHRRDQLRARRRSGPQSRETADFALFISWVSSSFSQAQLCHGDDRAFRRRTSWCWQVPVPTPSPATRELDQVFIDGICLHHDWVLLIARSNHQRHRLAVGRQRVHHRLPGATGSHPTIPGGNHRRRPRSPEGHHHHRPGRRPDHSTEQLRHRVSTGPGSTSAPPPGASAPRNRLEPTGASLLALGSESAGDSVASV